MPNAANQPTEKRAAVFGSAGFTWLAAFRPAMIDK
jgi:hypothetical protein